MHDAAPVRSTSSSLTATTPHILTFRVMRLTTPLPCRTSAMPFVTTTPTNSFLDNAPLWEGEGAPCGVGSLSVLPSSFGSIYASETFRSFISVFNRSTHTAHAISISIHMQTASQHRIQLFDSSQQPRASLEPRASINNVVKVALPELGIHVLVCAASYKDPTSSAGQMRTLRQFFRFNVLPPLEPSLSVLPLYRELDSFLNTSKPRVTQNYVHYLVDLRVLNAVPFPVYITSAKLTPKKPFQVRALLRDSPHSAMQLDQVDGTNESNKVVAESRHATMAVGDARNFLFHVYRKTNEDGAKDNESSTVARNAERGASTSWSRSSATADFTSHSTIRNPLKKPLSELVPSANTKREIGYMTISWRSALGELGHLENVILASEPLMSSPDVEVAIVAVPQTIRTHHPFVARCSARNNTENAVRLYLQIRRDLVGEIVPMGVSGVPLGEVLPGCMVRCNITLLPLARGHHSLSGVRVVDIDSNTSYKAESPIISVS